jgi:hypothetical protein
MDKGEAPTLTTVQLLSPFLADRLISIVPFLENIMIWKEAAEPHPLARLG